jgi:diguanylate cyclase (GGDEF)-like protein
MESEAERARRFDQEMGLVMLDIDNFKQVNDTYGHQCGDQVLAEVARVLRERTREIDAPARYGGEELAVVLPQTDLEGAYNLAERVRTGIEELELPIPNGNGSLRVTASFGVASLPSLARDSRELLAKADAALYRAKREGKNRTFRAG